MIVPSMDIVSGTILQSSADGQKQVKGDDPLTVADSFALAGELAVVDMDAALGRGENKALIEKLVRVYPCRVGGGIRDISAATAWLDAGAERIILGTAADLALTGNLPKSRIMAALDIKDGKVVVDGWKTSTNKSVFERIAELKDAVGGFLVTSADRMGKGTGPDLALIKEIKEAAGKKTPITAAGGISTPEQIAELDRMGVDAQVGMALHDGSLNLADGIIAPAKTDRPDGLWATVVVDELGLAVGLAYSNLESIREAVKRKLGAYHSRNRGLWVKGLTSGNTQELLGIRLDCDRDAIFMQVRQSGAGFCHNDTWTCWGEDHGIGRVFRKMRSRISDVPSDEGTEQVASDAADLIYSALTAMARAGVSLDSVEKELYKRSLRITQTVGDLKPDRS